MSDHTSNTMLCGIQTGSVWHEGAFDKEVIPNHPDGAYTGGCLATLFFHLEALCLNEHLWMGDSGATFQLTMIHDPLLAEAKQCGILSWLDQDAAGSDGKRWTTEDWTKRMSPLCDAGVRDMNLLSDLVLADASGFSAAVSPDKVWQVRGLYGKRASRSGSALASAYDGMADSLKKDVASLLDGNGEQSIVIPPIPALILAKASSPEDIVELTFEMRHKLSPIRSAFRDYEQAVKDDSLPKTKRLRAQRDLARICEDLARPFADTDAVDIAEWNIGEWLDVEKLEEGKVLGALAGKPLKLLAQWYRRRRVLQLFTLRRKYLAIASYSQLISKVFKFELNDTHVATFKLLSDQ